MQKHNKLSVRPLLTTKEMHDSKDAVGHSTFILANCGVGPAIIRSFVLLYDNAEVSRNNKDTYDLFLRNQARGCTEVFAGSLVPGGAIPAGGEHVLLSLTYDVQNLNVSFVDKLDILVEYQSVYEDEVRTYDSRKDRAWSQGHRRNE